MQKMKCISYLTWFLSMLSIYSTYQGDPGFDYFVFTQQWPETLCLKTVHENLDCDIYKNVSTWTIHGVWPSKTDGKSPMNCKPSAKFNPANITSIESTLSEYWPNLFPSTKHYDFWAHEWYKHGTCALPLKATSNEYLYFSTSLKLQQTYNLDKLFQDAKIVPSDTARYKLQDVQSAIKNAWSVNTTIECYPANKTTQYIWQIEVCLDLNFCLIDCPTKGGSCDHKNPFVMYPVIKHPYLSHW